jgi:HPr kinase/phosphorylase
MVEVRRIKPGTLVCRSMELIKHHMEIRGLGIINVQDLFGVASVRDQKQLELIVELEAWDPEAYYDRVGTDPVRRKEILGLEIDVVSIPVRPGRNLSDVIEVAARNRILKIRGVDSARRFQQKLLDEIAAAQPRRQRQESLETGE